MPFDLHIDGDNDLWALAKVVALPPVSARHAGGGHPPQHQSDTVRLSRTAEVLQLAEDGHTATTIARALGLPQEAVAAILTAERPSTDASPHLNLPPAPLATTTEPIRSPIASPIATQAPILVEAARDANGNLVLAPIPIPTSLAEAPPLAGPAGMTNPDIDRRHRRRRRRDRRSDSDPLWRWPLAEASAEPTAAPDPWRHVGQDEVLEAAAHEWTDSAGVPIPGGRLAVAEALEVVPDGVAEVSHALVEGLARRIGRGNLPTP